MQRRNRTRGISAPVMLVASIVVLGTVLVAPSVGVASTFRLQFITEPSDTVAGQVISPPVRVALVDESGAIVESFEGTVKVALGKNDTNAFLHGKTVVNAVRGVATFDDLIVDRAGVYVLIATAGDAEKGISREFRVSGVAVQCSTSPCEASTGNLRPTPDDPTHGKARVDVGECTTSPCPFLSIAEEIGSFCDTDGEGPCRGHVLLILPPSNAVGIARGTIVYDPSIVDVSYDKLRVFYEKNGAVREVFDCPRPPQTVAETPCSKRRLTSEGDVEILVAFDPTDPRIGT